MSSSSTPILFRESIPLPGPLDADSAAIVERRRQLNIPKAHQTSVQSLRQSRSDLNSANVAAGPDPHETRDLVVRANDLKVPVRLYLPARTEGAPATMYLHGGGWVMGTLDANDRVCRYLAAGSGSAVVSIDYRLAPEDLYPAALDDALAVAEWLTRGGGDLGIDGRRVAVVGASAGGNLAAAVTLKRRDQGAPMFCAQVLVYPVLDPDCDSDSYRENGDNPVLTRDEMLWYWKQYMGDRAPQLDPYAAPSVAQDLAGLPRSLVITAEHDPVRDDGETYARRMASFGVETELMRYAGTLHSFFGMPGILPQASNAVAFASSFLRSAFERAA